MLAAEAVEHDRVLADLGAVRRGAGGRLRSAAAAGPHLRHLGVIGQRLSGQGTGQPEERDEKTGHDDGWRVHTTLLLGRFWCEEVLSEAGSLLLRFKRVS